MDRATHIIDPNGEVIIILRSPNAPFADMSEVEEPAAEEPTTEGLAAEGPAAEGSAAEERVDAPVDRHTEEPAHEFAKESDSERAGQPEENCIHIQVSAKHLILASSVFKKILTGSWKEGIAYLQEGSVEITAQGWNTEALLVMLRIIHCQSYDVPRKLTLEMLAKIAVLADYYDCREAIDLVVSTWINSLDETIPSTYSRNLILWLWVAWYFRLPTEFEKVTAIAMSQSNDWVENLGLPIPDDIISMGTRILKYA
ncbi:uncharacterized protein LDX57_009352 [Aspergillus melleus]|uniref:uncharacterized protein n=1 Tax=Aspergillus melleus TaxID=138277 RepID=UPI001E8E3BA4|nr:uncharacterized protein LDX57_009352 [Aspergillus melleus]KAH8431698.1 hypothetical protein LDX57_009352 [Aspergillus melleus]